MLMVLSIVQLMLQLLGAVLVLHQRNLSWHWQAYPVYCMKCTVTIFLQTAASPYIGEGMIWGEGTGSPGAGLVGRGGDTSI
jgi:hypothetical protein